MMKDVEICCPYFTEKTTFLSIPPQKSSQVKAVAQSERLTVCKCM